jgi:hypothetical protein
MECDRYITRSLYDLSNSKSEALPRVARLDRPFRFERQIFRSPRLRFSNPKLADKLQTLLTPRPAILAIKDLDHITRIKPSTHLLPIRVLARELLVIHPDTRTTIGIDKCTNTWHEAPVAALAFLLFDTICVEPDYKGALGDANVKGVGVDECVSRGTSPV